jgi:hypothetical protein
VVLLDLTTEINSKQEELKTEIERKNYIRAAHLAASLNLNNDEIESLRYQALYQMAETHRNAHGTKILAQKYGYSQKEVKQILKEHANKISADGSRKPLKVRYDSFSGKYLTFEEWISHCIEKWDKLKVPYPESN